MIQMRIGRDAGDGEDGLFVTFQMEQSQGIWWKSGKI
jgi:hypothetical protein